MVVVVAAGGAGVVGVVGVVVAAGGVEAGAFPPVFSTVSVAVGAELPSDGPPLLPTTEEVDDPPDAKGDAPMNVVPTVPDPDPAFDAPPPDEAGAGVVGGVWKSGTLRGPLGGPALSTGWPFGPAPTVTTPATTESAAAATAMEATIRLPAKYGRGMMAAVAVMAAAASASGTRLSEVTRREDVFESCVVLNTRPIGRRPLHDPPLGIVQVKGLHCRHRNPKAPGNSYPLTATI